MRANNVFENNFKMLTGYGRVEYAMPSWGREERGQ